MAYPDMLTAAIYSITAVGVVLSAYITYKIYSKEGFR